jgi:ribosomal protein S20
MKTTIKKFDTAVLEGNREAAESAYKVAVKTVEHAASKGLIHKNNAAHRKRSDDKAERPRAVTRIILKPNLTASEDRG